MRRISIIGIGAGDPEYVTIQAIRVMRTVEVFFVVQKGESTNELVALRTEILERYLQDRQYRLITLRDPARDRDAALYSEAVEDWRARRAEGWGEAIAGELGEDGHGAFLVWGDPSLYDSTIAILDLLRESIEFDYEVIPGVSAVHALTARHGIALNRVAGSVQITTGRRLAREGMPAEVDDVVVMLDADCAFGALADEDIEIHWGAYLGTPDEILVSGPLREVAQRIRELRAGARERKGWIMDTYLLRRRSSE